MPNMLRITWNGLALHGGPLPGYAASHGCVRMPYDFAEKVFDKVLCPAEISAWLALLPIYQKKGRLLARARVRRCRVLR
jgi:hypothetical protein